MPTLNELLYGKVGGVNAIEHLTGSTWTAAAASDSWSIVGMGDVSTPNVAPSPVSLTDGGMGRATMSWGASHGTSAVFPPTGSRSWGNTISYWERFDGGGYWSSSAVDEPVGDNNEDAWYLVIQYNLNSGGASYMWRDRYSAFAVRCVKDE
jgi:hypothetical protein